MRNQMYNCKRHYLFFFFFQAEDGIRDLTVTGVQTCALPISSRLRVRHQKAGRKFSRSTAHRKAMSRNLVTSLLDHGRIETTEAKGKELRRWVEKVITRAKNDNVAARRAVDAIVEDPEVTERLFTKLMPRMKDRTGGYTRVLKIGPRLGDAAPMVLVELVDR